MDGDLRYISSPYSHDDPWVREERYKEALDYCVKRMQLGEIIFSPVVHTHHINRMLTDKSAEFWMRQHTAILKSAKRVVVLMLDGWKYSKGVKEEISLAAKYGIPVEYVEN